MSYSNKPPQISSEARLEIAQRARTDGWNRAVAACIEIVCPQDHKEEERGCNDIKKKLEKLYRSTRIQAWSEIIYE